MSKSPAIVAYSALNCGGLNASETWEYLTNSERAMSPQKRFHSPKYANKLCANFKDFSSAKKGKNPLCNTAILEALKKCLEQCPLGEIPAHRIGVFTGTSVGNVLESENALAEILATSKTERESLKKFLTYECSSLSDALARTAKVEGARFAISTACSSSGLALAATNNAIRLGEIDAAIVCGADTISRITVNGFASLELLSNSSCAPFDANRDGITLGEAACVMILTNAQIAEQLGLNIRAYLRSSACTCDAYHATSPHPEAEGMSRAIEQAISRSQIPAEEIDYYNAHGTGTSANDSLESIAIKRVWQTPPPFSSVKGKFGHTLGASGLLNAIISCQAIEKNTLPSSFGFTQEDEKLAISPLRECEEKQCKNIVSSSFGFGGNNATVVISKDAGTSKEEPQDIEIFIDGAGAIHNNALGVEQTLSGKNANETLEIIKLLPKVSPLKKRRFAKLQQMALHALCEASENENFDSDKTCVCFGTGLGMIERTRKFVENVIEKSEEEALPTAFTNSVHNAISSAIAIHFKLKGLNSATTAKELSFECALWQASLEMRSRYADCAIVGSCDEHIDLISQTRKHAISFSNSKIPSSEIAAAYVLRTSKSEKSFAKLVGIEIANCKKSPSEEAKTISQFLERKNVKNISSILVPFSYNKAQKRYIEELAKELNLNLNGFYQTRFGANYSLSALAPLLAREQGKGVHLAYTKSSTGQRAITIWEIL